MLHSVVTCIRAGLAIGLVAAGLLLLAGCPQSSPLTINASATPAPVLSSASPATRSTIPISATNIRAAISRLPDLVKKEMTATDIPGVAVAVVHDGKTLFAQGFGVRKEGGGKPVTADTVFQIASFSKSISATVIAKVISNCAAEGSGCSISWNMRVHKYLPIFSLQSSWVTQHVTVGDLLSHRSGLPGAAGDDLQSLGFHRQQIFSRLSQLPLGPFRDQYAYANFGYTAGAIAVANAAGLDWADLAQQELFAPLGMDSTSYRYSDYKNQCKADNCAVTHVKRDGRWQALYQFDDDAAAPAGGVSSSVKDLAQWAKLILADGRFDGKQLIQPAALLPAVTPHAVAEPADKPATRTGFYGYGIGVMYGMSGRVKLLHSGAFTSGAATTYELIPSADIGIVVLTNASPIGAAETIASQFSDIVQYGEIRTDWPVYWDRYFHSINSPSGDCAKQDPPSSPAPPGSDNTYVGTYHSTYFGDAVVAAKNGQLTLALGPKPVEYTLKPWNGNEFVIDLSENTAAVPKSYSSVWFTGASSGTASGLIVTALNGDGDGSCKRQPGADSVFKPYSR